MNHPAVQRTICLIVVLLFAQPALPCSTFFFQEKGNLFFGRNYDWMVPDGLVMVNKRNVTKSAMVFDLPATWTSKYGSVTFNQYGRDFPTGGINEAGLVVELMWLEETRYPDADHRGAVNCLQWIQYQLDTCATVKEVVASDQDIRISASDPATVHYLVADKSGNCATIEFIDGKMVCHRADTLPICVLTNNSYKASLAYLEKHEGFGGGEPIQRTGRSLDRFVRAANGVRNRRPHSPDRGLDHAFDILADIAQGEYTQWSIVYDISQAKVYFRTHTAGQRRFFDVHKFDFSCEAPVKVLDMNMDLEGEVTDRFIDYTQELNRRLIANSYSRTPFLKDFPAPVLEAISWYPRGTTCGPVAAETPAATPAPPSPAESP
jgi:choloylglycine hydrolase